MALLFAAGAVASAAEAARLTHARHATHAARHVRLRHGRRAPILLGPARTLPIEQALSPDVLNQLATGDLEHAVRGLLMEPASEKSLYLLREAQRIGEYATIKPGKATTCRFYLSLGAAHHNLYLFLQRNGRANPRYVRAGLAAYARARRAAATPAERGDADILTAALLAAVGKERAADRSFRRADAAAMQGTFQGASNLATYYAARRDTPRAIAALRAAHQRNAAELRTWLRVADDFAGITGDPAFAALLNEWKVFEPMRPAAVRVLPPHAVKKQSSRHHRR